MPERTTCAWSAHFTECSGLRLPCISLRRARGRVAWPVAGNLVHLAIAGAGGFGALHWAGDLSRVFLAQSAGLVAFGLINAVPVAGGAWFGRVCWPAKRNAVPHPYIDTLGETHEKAWEKCT
jgi:hypothetical protein